MMPMSKNAALVIYLSLLVLLWPVNSRANGTLQGYVTNHLGEAVVGAQVAGPDGSTVTAEDGYYSLQHTEGVYSFSASASGYVTRTFDTITLSTDGVTNLDFILSPMVVSSTYPSLAILDSALQIEINGGGFDSSTRVSLMPDSGNAANIVGRFTPEDAFETMAIDLVGTVGYIVGGGPDHEINVGRLYVVDVSNPTETRLLGSCDLPGFGRDVAVNGSHAYITYGKESTSKGGLCVVDISDPASPQLLDSVQLDVAYGVAVVDNTAYVVDGNCDEIFDPDNIPARGNLHAIDVSNPSAPALKWSLDAQYSFPTCGRGLKIQGSLAYVANGLGGLRIIDINPGSATFQHTLNTPVPGQMDARGVEVAASHAFIAGEQRGLWIFDVSTPANVTLAGLADTPGYSRNVQVKDNIAYVADLISGLAMFDVSNPSAPTRLGSVDTDDQSRDVTVMDGLAYVPDGEGGLNIIDVSTPRPSTLVGSLESNADAHEVILDGTTLFMAQDDGLQIIDVSNPSAPKQKSLIGLGGGSAFGIALEGTKMYVAAYDEDLRIIDLDTKSVTPVELDNGANYTWSAAVNDDFIFIGDGDLEGGTTGGLNLIDRTDPTYATQDRIELGGCVTDIVVLGQYAYVTVKDGDDDNGYDDNGLKIIDINPDSPNFRSVKSHINIDAIDHPAPLGLAVDGSYAYVASDWLGVTIFDITEPTAPQKVGSSGRLSGGVARSVKVVGNIAYVANSNSGVFVLDVQDTTNPVIIGYVDTPGFARDIAVDGTIAHVADDGAGLTTVELPIEFTANISQVNPDQIKATLPSPLLSGNYTVRVFDAVQNDALLGAVTFSDRINLLSSKAIIVAGGGDYTGNQIWEETKAYANYAYDNLIYQGYKHEDITYLTDEPSPLARYGSLASFANVKSATKANLQDAILTWAAQGGTSDLLIFMEDHGNTGEFIVRGGSSPEVVTADELDSWLDTLQATLPGKVILVYDACRSGSFISRLTPPSGKTRLTLTSSSPDQTAYFLSNNHSFSSHFWSTFSGKTGNKAIMTEAFARATANMAPYQASQLDANGNGVPNEEEDYTALQGYEGTIYALRRQYNYRNRSKPVISIVSEDQTASGAGLMAQSVYDVDGDGISRVWAEIYPPDFNSDPGSETVTSALLPSVSFSGPDENGEYTPTTAPQFPVHGTYIITYYAEDNSGIYSLPRTSLVTQTGGTSAILADQYEDDNSPDKARVIVPNSPTPQNHSFHVSGDQDWVEFYGMQSIAYNIKALDPTIISDPAIDIFSSDDLNTPILSSNTVGAGVEEAVIGWICPADGLYYARITNNSSHFGANVRYKLQVYSPIALSLPGYVTGRITSGGEGVAGAVLKTESGTAITLADGSFILFLSPGSYPVVSVSCSGYRPTSFSVTIGSGEHVSLSAQGINIVENLNLGDAILVLQAVANTSVDLAGYKAKAGDIDGDGDIGLAEAIYVLQAIAGQRE
jgi:hypothetical protein